MENKFKTIHENKVLINPPTESLVDKMQVTQLLNNMKSYILSLQRYYCESCQSSFGNYSDMTESEEGEYVKIEDVLKLFGAEKELKTEIKNLENEQI